MADHGHLREALDTLLREILYGSQGEDAFVVNRGDRGLLASLDQLSAEAASAHAPGRPSAAAHVDHLCYGLGLLNRWAIGEDPWTTADYRRSWQRQRVSEAEWTSLRASLREIASEWMTRLLAKPDWDRLGVTTAVASVVHLAYHVGAIRQVAGGSRGPEAND
jgi:hypothetical protein